MTSPSVENHCLPCPVDSRVPLDKCVLHLAIVISWDLPPDLDNGNDPAVEDESPDILWFDPEGITVDLDKEGLMLTE
jgi:hypothetical protein